MDRDDTLRQVLKASSLRRFFPLMLSVSLILVWKPASAEVVIRERTQSYSIYGLSNKQLLEDIRAKGPHLEKLGRRVHGYTHWKITWRISYITRGSLCSIDRVEVLVDTTIVMPYWVNEISGNDNVKKQWRQYYSALQEHEYGHKKLAVDGAHEIDRGIMAIKPRASCGVLGKAANALGKRILLEIRQRNEDYDLATNHEKLRL